MKRFTLLVFVLLIAGCNDFTPLEPPHPAGIIVVNVHWQTQGVADIPVVVVQTGDSVRTGTNGLAIFPVPAGHYVVRVYGINRGGPVVLKSDFEVDVEPGEVTSVDIVDCLPCV
jgi:hypothetical protein